jgi:Xaa-Pro aminopeptidase
MSSFRARRDQVLNHMQQQGGGAALLRTAPEQVRSNDTDFPFRHDSDFYYLSGFTEPHSALLLIAKPDGTQESLLFCREKNPEREIWDGFRHGPEAAREQFGFDRAWPIEALAEQLALHLADLPALYYPLATRPDVRPEARLDTLVAGAIQAVRAQRKSPPATCHDLAHLLAEMRLFKDPSEIELMQRAADISVAAHLRAMRATAPGRREYEIEAELLYEFRRGGAQFPAYAPIVASGANSCILHYGINNGLCSDGDLLLIDAGCEFDGYCADITRTFPVNGRFSGAQKDCYQLVLAAQQAAIAQAMPGRPYNAIHDAAVSVLAQGMLDLGLLDANKVGTLSDVIEHKTFRQFYMHGTGHWLGMDVHDVGDYRAGSPRADGERAHRKLEAGMVLTVEPGLYVRPAEGVPEAFWQIGIRIEDDILITPDDQHNLTGALPVTVEQIEAVMREAREGAKVQV